VLEPLLPFALGRAKGRLIIGRRWASERTAEAVEHHHGIRPQALDARRHQVRDALHR
jgi:hypothetical protein